VRVTGKVDFSGHPHLADFRFVKDHAKVEPKMTIPAPSTLHFRQGRPTISKDVYPISTPASMPGWRYLSQSPS
jgi:5-methyltetrahydropteroyltriglutamate--homocysteine methyltransferase